MTFKRFCAVLRFILYKVKRPQTEEKQCLLYRLNIAAKFSTPDLTLRQLVVPL